MYAVFVIAAILLSVSPMHARTLLAALPATAPGHQFAPDDQDYDQNQGQRTTSPHLPSAARATSGLSRTSYSPDTTETSAASSPAPAHPAAATGLLEHSPNAP